MQNLRMTISLYTILLFMASLSGPAHAAVTYTVSINNPSGSGDLNLEEDHKAYGIYKCSASLDFRDKKGELKAVNEQWSWSQTSKFIPYQGAGGSGDEGGAFDPNNTPSTTLHCTFSSAGYYDITVKASVTFNTTIINSNGTIQDTGLTQSNKATFRVCVAAPDFLISTSPAEATVLLEDKTTITVTGTPIHGFNDEIGLGLYKAPSGVNASSSMHIPGPDQYLDITVGSDATPGDYNFDIEGSYAGSQSEGIPPLINLAPFILHIPKRYVEIGGPYDNTLSKSGPNIRAPKYDGSLIADAAAAYRTETSNPGTGGWHGTGAFSTQNIEGFKSDKSYDWTVTYGGENGIAHGPQDNINPSYTIDDYLIPGFSGSQSLGKSTAISVAVANAQGSKPFTANYTIHWHFPHENWSTVGQATYAAPEAYSQSPEVTAGASVSVIMSTDNSPVTAGGVLAGVLQSGGASTTLFVSNPVEVAGIASLLAAANFALSISIPPTPQPQQGSTSFSQFTADLGIQRAIDAGLTTYSGSGGQAAVIPEPSSQRIDPSIVNAIDNGTYSSNDIYNGISGIPKVSAHAGRFRFVQLYEGDQYGSNGYEGRIQKPLNRPGTFFFVYRWAFTLTNPGPS